MSKQAMAFLMAVLFVLLSCSELDISNRDIKDLQDAAGEEDDESDGDCGDCILCENICSGWVLHDANGDAVSIHAESVYSKSGVVAADFGDPVLSDCFVVPHVGMYGLETGLMNDCYDEIYSEQVHHFNSHCSDDMYWCASLAPTESPLLFNIEGKMYYIHGMSSMNGITEWFTYQNENTRCAPNGPGGESFASCWKLDPVPSEILSAFANPPYSISFVGGLELFGG